MITVLFVAGPAVLLAVMAWAVDRFTPIPSDGLKDSSEDHGSTTDFNVHRALSRSVPSFRTLESIRRNIERAEQDKSFVPVEQAVDNLGSKRSKRMIEDHFPDPVKSKCDYVDAFEASGRRYVSQKDGKVKAERV